MRSRRRLRPQPQPRPRPQLQGILWRSSWGSVWGEPLRPLPRAALDCRRTATLPKQVNCAALVWQTGLKELRSFCVAKRVQPDLALLQAVPYASSLHSNGVCALQGRLLHMIRLPSVEIPTSSSVGRPKRCVRSATSRNGTGSSSLGPPASCMRTPSCRYIWLFACLIPQLGD